MTRILLPAVLATLSLALVPLAGCSKKKDSPAPPSSGGSGGGGGGGSLTMSSSPTLLMTVNGAPVTLTAGTMVDAVVGSGGSTWKYYSSGLWTVAGTGGYEIVVGRAPGPAPSTTAFNALFTTGARAFVDDLEMASGVTMYNVDAAGDYWSTTCGDQTGSTLNITQVEYVPGGLGFDRAKVLGTFTCKLYDCVGGGVKIITNGQFRLDFEKI